MTKLLLFLYLLTFGSCYGLKYLVYNPKFSGSHVLLMGKLADELANAGHDVTVIQTKLNNDIKYVGHTNKRVKLIEVEVPQRFPNMAEVQNVWEGQMDPSVLTKFGAIFRDACLNLYNNTDVITQLKTANFDLGVGELFDVCGLGLFKYIGLQKWITVFGSGADSYVMETLGVPPIISVTPGFFAVSADRGFVSRVKDQMGYWFGKYIMFPFFHGGTAEAFKVFDKDLTIEDLISQSSYIWVNNDEVLDFPRPITHKYINIAGFGMKKALSKAGQLDAKYHKIYDQAKKGVVYMSFGSVAESQKMPEGMKKAILEAFAEFPDIQFIWKYESAKENIAKDFDNVHTHEWLPQREILAHPKTLVFVTHAGMNSITEATYAGMPTITIPLFGDQTRNAGIVSNKGVSKMLEKDKLFDKQAIVETLRAVVEDPGYKQRAARLSEMIKNKPYNVEQRIVDTAEFAAKYDVHSAFDISGKDLNAFAFYNLDVFLSLIVTVVIVLLIPIFAIRCAWRVCRRLTKQKSE